MDGKFKFLVLGICTLLIASTFTVAAGVLPDHGESEIVLVSLDREDDLNHIASAGNDIEILERYPDRALIEIPVDSKRTLHSRGVEIIDRLPARTQLSIKDHQFDIEGGMPEFSDDLTIENYEEGEKGLYIVQTIGPIHPDWKESMKENGAEIINYAPNHAYEIKATPGSADEIEDLYFVERVEVYQPGFKLAEDLELGTVSVTFSDGSRMVEEIEDENRLIELANRDDVYHIGQYHEPQLLDEMATQIIGGGLWIHEPDNDPDTAYRGHGDYGSYVNQLGYEGEDVVIAVADTGIGNGTTGDSGHPDFTGRVIGGYSWSTYGWGDDHGHGTHCSGSIAGDTHNGTGEEYYSDYYASQGSAPRSELYSVKIFDGGVWAGPNDDYQMVEKPKQQADAYIHSNSWASAASGGYAASSSAFDAATRDANSDTDDNEPMIITVAAGNEGPGSNSIGAPATAKNVISVGATENYNPNENVHNPDNVVDFSSRGWTDDNRIKPDVVAPGSNVYSTMPDGDYSTMSGTSMSNPAVAGASAVVVEWYEDNYGYRPSPAMVKAMLINTAYQLDESEGNTGTIPNKDEGWGMVNLPDIIEPSVDFMLEDQSSLLTTGETDHHTITPDDTNEPLKISLVWTDAAAEAFDSQTLKNDLDLTVKGPGGETYIGNSFTDGWTEPGENTISDFDQTGDGYDDVNNVENVYIEDPDLGSYEIEVHGQEITADANNDGEANQDYALVVSNAGKPSVEIERPSGGESFEHGEVETIEWTAEEHGYPLDSFDIEYSLDGGNSYEMLAEDIVDADSYDWEVPDVATDEAVIRISVYDTEGLGSYDTTDEFTISGKAPSPPEDGDVELYGDDVQILFEDDVEDGDIGYISDAFEVDDWEYDQPSEWDIRQNDAWVGENSWDWGDGNYHKEEDVGLLSWLITPEIEIPEETDEEHGVEFTFQHWRDFGSGMFDGGNMRISTEGAHGNFELIEPEEGYDGTIDGSYDNPLGGLKGWGGSEDWETATFDLTDYIGEDIHIRWDAGTEAYDDGGRGGWRIDDLSIDGLMPCPEGEDHNFVTWEASPDESDKVSHYTIYRSDERYGDYEEIETIDADGSESYEYLDENRGAADDTIWWYEIKVEDRLGQRSKETLSINEPGEMEENISSIEVEPESETVKEGDKAFYTAIGYDEEGNEIGDITTETAWSIEEGAGGRWDQENGTYTAENVGTWTVTAEYQNFSDQSTLTVEVLEVDSVVLSPENDQEVKAGEELQFHAEAYDEDEDLIEDDPKEFDWQHAEKGTFEKTDSGEYNVTATYGDVTSPMTAVIVLPAEPGYIEIDPSIDQTITSGDLIDFSAEVFDEYDNIIERDDSSFDWEAEDASISGSGLFDETEPGEYEVTATYEEVTSPITTVRIEIAPPEDLEVELCGQGIQTLYEDDVNEGDLGYTIDVSDPDASKWDIREHDSVVGESSWDFGDEEFNKDGSEGMLSWLITPEIEIPEETDDDHGVVFTFEHWRDFGDDSQYDGGNVKISTEGVDGPWNLLYPEEGYDGTVPTDWDNPLGGEEAWGGENIPWETATFDLTDYIGESIHIRWDAGTEAWDGYQGEGWRIDDIHIEGLISDPEGEAHNLVSWETSPDDPEEVSHYNIYRAETEDGPWDEATLIDEVEADGSESYEYLDKEKGEADDVYWWYLVRAVGEDGYEEKNEDVVQQPGAEPSPLPPTHPEPTDGSTGLNTELELSVSVQHEEEENMDVEFYEASEETLIDIENNVASGDRAGVNWSGLDYETRFDWYAVAEDDDGQTARSPEWSFTTKEEIFTPLPPTDPQPEHGEESVNTTVELSALIEHESGTNMERDTSYFAEYGDPPTNYRTPAQRERAGEILLRWDWSHEGYHTDLAVAISGETTARIVAEDSSEASSIEDTLNTAGAKMDNVETIEMGAETPQTHWIRDYGPVPIVEKDTGEVSFLNMEYAWGDDRAQGNNFPKNYAEKIGVDHYDVEEDGDWFVLDGGHKFVEGSGVLYTTDDVYDQNSHLGDEEEVEQWATEYMNLESFETVDDLSGTGHIDMQVNILDENTVLVSEFVNPSVDPNDAEVLDDTAEFFEEQTARNGEPFEVKRLPMQVESSWFGPNTYYTHANSLIVNDLVIVPTFGEGTDAEALNVYEEALPDHEIIGIEASAVADQGGAVHCTTREIPEANAPPSIEITTVDAVANQNVKVEAEITTDAEMDSAHVYYSTENSDLEKIEMYHVESDFYEAELGSYDLETELQYFVRVEDDHNAVTYNGDAWDMHTSIVEEGEVNMDISFYDASDDSLIGTYNDAKSGDRAATIWDDLDHDTTYRWYAVADDGTHTSTSPTWNFTTEPEPVADIEIKPEYEKIIEGEQVDYTATAYDEDGDKIYDVTAETTWSIEDGAGGEWDQENGIYTSETPGEWTVTGEYEGEIDEANLTVEREGPKVDAVVITPEEDRTVKAGEELQFSAEAYCEDEDLIEDDPAEFDWKNASAGIFEEVETGQYDVTASYQGVTSPIVTLTVEPGEVDHIVIAPEEDQSVTPEETLEFYAKAYDGYDNLITDHEDDFTWKNASAGVFEEVELGEYYVIASYQGVTSPIVTLTVEPGEVDHVVIAPEEDQSVTPEETLEFYAAAYDGYDNLITDHEDDFTWKNASAGIFEEVETGQYDVSASYQGVTSPVTSISVFEVDQVLIYPEEDQTLMAGDTIDFTAEAYDIDGDLVEDDDFKFQWENTDKTGLFDKTEVGDYLVTATYENVTSEPTMVTVESPELIENKVFEDGYEPWELTREVDEGEARWDQESHEEGGSVYVMSEAEGSGSRNTEESYWEQEIGPTSDQIELEGVFRKNINTESGWFWSAEVHHATVEILVHDTEIGWQTIFIDDDTSDGNTGWIEFDPVSYEPAGEIDALRVQMHVETEGDSSWFSSGAASVDIWVDSIDIIQDPEPETTAYESSGPTINPADPIKFIAEALDGDNGLTSEKLLPVKSVFSSSTIFANFVHVIVKNIV